MGGEEGEEAQGEEEEAEEERCGVEEGGQGPLQGEDVLFGPRVHHRQEQDEFLRRREGGLGVHQEEGAQQRAQRQGGWRGFRRRLDVQARGRHPEAPEVSALVVWSWISCRSYRAPAEARSDVYARGFGGDLE